jgi:hypothetical protein
MCSNNGCTEMSDKCVVICVDDANKVESIERFPFAMGIDDLKRMLAVVVVLRDHFRDKTVFSATDYTLSECVVSPLVETVLLRRGIVKSATTVTPRNAGDILMQAEMHLHNLVASRPPNRVALF